MKILKIILFLALAIFLVYSISHLFAYLLMHKLFSVLFGACVGIVLLAIVIWAGYSELKKTGLLKEIKEDPKKGWKKFFRCNYSIYY